MRVLRRSASTDRLFYCNEFGMGGMELKKIDEEEERRLLLQEKKRKILAALAVGVVCFSIYGWWRRTEPISTAVLSPAPAVADASHKPQGDAVVYVSGMVEHPGVVRIQTGARVIDAVNAAGGLLSGAELHQINLAQAVRDGMQIHVPGSPKVQANSSAGQYREELPVENRSKTTTASVSQKTGKININTADASELDGLPGVGPSMAAKIVEWRKANGPFLTGTDLKKVKGIGEAKYQKLKDRISW